MDSGIYLGNGKMGNGKWARAAFFTVILNLFQDPPIRVHDEENVHRVPFGVICVERHETVRRET